MIIIPDDWILIFIYSVLFFDPKKLSYSMLDLNFILRYSFQVSVGSEKIQMLKGLQLILVAT